MTMIFNDNLMHQGWRWIFTGLLLFATYHLVRDISTILGVHHPFVDFLHRDHIWCAPYCRYATLPLEIFEIIAAGVVLKRQSIGILGFLSLASLPFWLLAQFLP